MNDSDIRAVLARAEAAKGHSVPAMAGHECVWIDCEFRADIPALCRELLAAREALKKTLTCRASMNSSVVDVVLAALGEEVMP